MATLHEMINAWIFLSKGEPSGTVRTNPSPCDPDVMHPDVYGAVDIVTLIPAVSGHDRCRPWPGRGAGRHPSVDDSRASTTGEVDTGLQGHGATAEPDDRVARWVNADSKTYFGYRTFTCWRLNSDRYVFEQTQQKALYALVLNG